MTINVIVKCPAGVVMGTDSLGTLVDDEGDVRSMIPFYYKLFPLGLQNNKEKNYAAGVLVNGAGSIAGRNIEDIIGEFYETYKDKYDPDNYDLKTIVLLLADTIQNLIDTIDNKENPILELIIGGYSRNKNIKKIYSEIYSIYWEQKPYYLRELYTEDTQFGTHYGGQTKILDRFKYGIDDYIIEKMWHKKDQLFNNIRTYIINELSAKGVNIPPEITVDLPNTFSEILKSFNIYSLVSKFEEGKSAGETVKNIKYGMFYSLETMERFFSLQTALNYCIFLLNCGYAESAFTYVLPTVGSEMRIATITKEDGFKFVKQWEVQTPSSPFR